MIKFKVRFWLNCFLIFAYFPDIRSETDPLPSWNAGTAKNSIIQFLNEVTNAEGKNFVPTEERIATFDQDGTLWVEQPLYTQFFFAIDRLKNLAPQHPEWKDQHLLTLINGNPEAIQDLTAEGLETLVAETHAGMSIEAFHDTVRQWLRQTLHPRFKKRFTDLIYQPMLEVIQLFKSKGFKTYIVSGGGQEFIRVYAEVVYGIPPEQIIGTTSKVKYEYQNGQPVLLKLAKILFVDNGPGKPEAINLMIGRRPIAAFGNSDGDRQMLEWTQAAKGKHLELLVHHDDAEREYAYDADSKIGTFSVALMQEAKKQKWIIVSMKEDWKVIFPWQKP